MIRRLDRLQTLVVAGLCLLGAMTVYSARADWVRQSVWVGLGLIAYTIAAACDYRRLRAIAPAL